MIYQPRNVKPTQTSVDADVTTNYFYVELNTNGAVSGHQLTILNWDNTIRYTGERVDYSALRYNGDEISINIPSVEANLENGNDYKWYLKLYQQEANMYITYGLVQAVVDNLNIRLQKNINIKAGMVVKCVGETKNIVAYDDTTGIATIDSAFTSQVEVGSQYQVYSNFIQTVPEYILHMRKTPEISIEQFPNPLPGREYLFKGTYTQEDNVPLSYHRWIIGIPNENDTSSYNVVKDTGRVYSADISIMYDGFKSGVNYIIILQTENEFGITNYVQQYFSASYDEIQYNEVPSAKVNYNKNAIQLDWTSPIEVNPIVWDTNILSGTILPGEISSNSFYISKGILTIEEGNIITINNVELHIQSYSYTTGKITVRESLPESLEVGASYYIQGYGGAIENSTELYFNTPYQGTNSLDTKKNKLIYEREKGEPIGEYPNDWEITMQFKPNKDFFYGTTGVFRDIINIASVESDASDNVSGMILIFAHIYDIVGVYPQNTNGVANIQTLNAPPSGESNTEEYVYLNESIDLSTTSYIYFPAYSYIEKISNFDSTTLKAEFSSPLPFVPEAGDKYVMMVTLKASFYSNPINQWLLQSTNQSDSTYDYRWIDESNTWDDDKYWVEGGTAIVRIAESWWKVKLTNSSIRLEKGGY